MSDAIDWDAYGHCVICHKNMAFKQVIGMKEVKRFSPDYCEGEYLLDDGSKMLVAMCQACKAKTTEEDLPKIMDTVIRGWGQEVEKLEWSKEKQSNYMDRYSQLNIVCDSEDKPNDFLAEKVQLHKAKIAEKKLKELKDGNRK